MFSANVMVRVATRPAVNPVGVIARQAEYFVRRMIMDLVILGKILKMAIIFHCFGKIFIRDVRKLSLGGIGGSMARNAPHLSLPGKLMFPSRNAGHFSMLGLGDIVSPDQISMTEPEVKQKSPLNETNIFLSS